MLVRIFGIYLVYIWYYILGPAQTLQQWEHNHHYFSRDPLLTFMIYCYSVLAGPTYYTLMICTLTCFKDP